MRLSTCIALAPLPWLALACVDKGPSPVQKEIDPAYIAKNLLPEVPGQMTHRVAADFGGKVTYLGNDLDSDMVAPGGKVRVVHYWRVIEPPGPGWRVFAHLVGDRKEDWANIDYSDMRRGYGPEKWQAGDIIRDEQEFTIPDGWGSASAKVLVGLFPKGGHTAADRMPVVSGPVDAESRVTAATLKIQKSKNPQQAPVKAAYAINQVRGHITVDGVADEDDWKTAKPSPAFLTAEGLSPALEGETRARMVWDNDYLYVFVEMEDSDVFSPYREHDDDLWKADVVEVFIDADRNRRGYVELQVNPNNAQFDAYFPTTRGGQNDKEWSANMQSKVVVNGTPDDRADKDKGWAVEIAIPMAAVKGRDAAMAVSLPPKQGDRWRLNVVRVDKPKSAKNITAGSWNPITSSDFHALDRMLEVVFADGLGLTEPPKQPAETEPAEPGTEPGAGAQPAEPAEPAAKPAKPAEPAAKPEPAAVE